jgi:hypothetical protein
MATTFSEDGFTLRRTAIALAVGLALFAAGVVIEERRR